MENLKRVQNLKCHSDGGCAGDGSVSEVSTRFGLGRSLQIMKRHTSETVVEVWDFHGRAKISC
jgi:hypothetical protein